MQQHLIFDESSARHFSNLFTKFFVLKEVEEVQTVGIPEMKDDRNKAQINTVKLNYIKNRTSTSKVGIN